MADLSAFVINGGCIDSITLMAEDGETEIGSALNTGTEENPEDFYCEVRRGDVVTSMASLSFNDAEAYLVSKAIAGETIEYIARFEREVIK